MALCKTIYTAKLKPVIWVELHSLNNLPACVIQWLCWMYSTFEKRNKWTEFLLFFLLVTLKEEHTIKEQKKIMKCQKTLWHITYFLQCNMKIRLPSITNAEYNKIPLALSGSSSPFHFLQLNKQTKMNAQMNRFITVMLKAEVVWPWWREANKRWRWCPPVPAMSPRATESD